MSTKNITSSQPEGGAPDPFASLDQDIKAEFLFYLGQPEEWKKENQGKFVVIKNKEIHNILEDYKDALSYAVNEFGDEKFLIHQVGAEDMIHYTTQALMGAA